MCLVLGKDATDSIRWWVRCPSRHAWAHWGYNVHGTGSVFSSSWKQKLVMRSSTESEVVGVYDVLPQILWTKKFLEDQGVGIKDTVLYQDNMSSMLLERNGRQSSTKRTKHMDIRYFYVGDDIQNKTVSLHNCPTEGMLADYFTKPLHGSLFVRLRNFIMGAEFDDGNPQTQRTVLGCDDAHTTMNASKQNQAASDVTTDASEHNQVASEREQHEITPAPAQDLNNEFVCGAPTAPRDQNNKNACGVRRASRDQNNENTRDEIDDHDQNNKKVYGTSEECGGRHNTQITKMTYREALIGVDNAEPSSDI